MTKNYFFLLLTIISLAAHGQIAKKSILLGGQLYYYNGKNRVGDLEQQVKSGAVGLSIGQAFKENQVAGISLNFSPYRQSNLLTGSDTVDLRFDRYDIGAFYREYKTLAKDFYFFCEVEAAFITANQTEHYKIAGADVNVRQRGGFISLTPGISYQVFKKMQLEIIIPNILSAQYLMTKIDSDVSQVKDTRQEEWLFYSNVNNNNALGFLGVGFRFVL